MRVFAIRTSDEWVQIRKSKTAPEPIRSELKMVGKRRHINWLDRRRRTWHTEEVDVTTIYYLGGSHLCNIPLRSLKRLTRRVLDFDNFMIELSPKLAKRFLNAKTRRRIPNVQD